MWKVKAGSDCIYVEADSEKEAIRQALYAFLTDSCDMSISDILQWIDGNGCFSCGDSLITAIALY